MTRKEWIEKHLPAYVNDRADGGVIGCPRSYRELVRMDPRSPGGREFHYHRINESQC